MTTIRLELGIDAQKFMQQVQIYNQGMEAEVSKGIQMALDEIIADDNFALLIKNRTKEAIENIAYKVVMSWEIKDAIYKMINERVNKKVEEYADRIAEKITKSLE